jgi:hypothetical protein
VIWPQTEQTENLELIPDNGGDIQFALKTFRKLIFKMVTSVVAICAICSRHEFSDGLK